MSTSVAVTPRDVPGSKIGSEREWTGQRFHSKQGLSCPRFFLSIPVLNGLPTVSKPVHGFSYAFLTVFFLFAAYLPVKPVQKSCEG